ncbi:hypothetical protein Tco_1341641 [Tanacetum coccineum]
MKHTCCCMEEKPELEIMSMDDLYNNLKVYEPEVKGTSSSSSNTQNVAFVSSNSNTAHGVTTASTQATVVNSTTIDNLSDAVADGYANNKGKEILEEDWKELFFKWAPRNQENRNRETTRRVVPVEATTSNALISCDGAGYDWSDQAEEGPTNFALMAYTSTSSNSELNDIAYKTGLESVEARLLVYKKNESVYEEDIKVLKHEIHLREVAITELRRKLELAQKQKDEIQLIVENFENLSKNLSKLIDCQIVDKCKIGLGYNVVPPPYTGNFMPPKLDMSFFGLEEFTSEPIVIKPIVEKSEAKPKAVKNNIVFSNIEDWLSDNEEDDVPQAKIEKKTVKPSFAKIEFVKPKGKTAKQVEQLRQNTHTPRGNQRN